MEWLACGAVQVSGSAARPVSGKRRGLICCSLPVHGAGRAIHLPLDQGHPLVTVLRAALGVGARGDLKVRGALRLVLLQGVLLGCVDGARAHAAVSLWHVSWWVSSSNLTCLRSTGERSHLCPPAPCSVLLLLQKEWAAGREVAGALLELFLTAEETSEVRLLAGRLHDHAVRC